MGDPVRTEASPVSLLFHRGTVVLGVVLALVGLARLAFGGGDGLVWLAIGATWVGVAGRTCIGFDATSAGLVMRSPLRSKIIPPPCTVRYTPRRLEGIVPSYFVQGRVSVHTGGEMRLVYRRVAAGPWADLVRLGAVSISPIGPGSSEPAAHHGSEPPETGRR